MSSGTEEDDFKNERNDFAALILLRQAALVD